MESRPHRFDTYEPRVVSTARRLRRNATVPERLLWSRLRRQHLGDRFLRQHPVGSYVVDFCCPDANLIVEVDGRSHDGCGDADWERQAALKARGFCVVRVTNDEVLRDLGAVVSQIAEVLDSLR